MFMWVAGASVIVSVSFVVGWMMIQKAAHNQKAINELSTTVKTLESNNKNVGSLEDKLRSLGSNEALLALRSNDTDNALRVILDALPSDANPSALGASLQSKLFGDVTVESNQVTPVGGDGALIDESADTTTSDSSTDAQSITFQFSVRGGAAELKELLTRLERSIRTIQITSVKLDSSGTDQVLTVEGQAYYLPAKTLELKNKDIPRS
jgi:hypothetical protein